MNPYAQFPFIGQVPKESRQPAGNDRTAVPDPWISSLAYRAIDALWGAGRSLATALRAHTKRRRAIDQLSGLDDGTLKDIGLHRSEIRSAVEETLVLEAAAKTASPARPPRRPERIVRFAPHGRRKPANEHRTKAAA